mgnify:CR=1 FL=1
MGEHKIKKYRLKEPVCGYKEGTLVKVFDWSGDLKTLMVQGKKGPEFLYAREKQIEKVEGND